MSTGADFTARERRAIELHTAGESLEVIASCLGASLDDARDWIADPLAGYFDGPIPREHRTAGSATPKRATPARTKKYRTESDAKRDIAEMKAKIEADREARWAAAAAAHARG